MPVIVYEFRALEFLKGEGTKSLLVSTSFGASGDSWRSNYELYETEEDAITAGLRHIPTRDESWDEHKAIIFISEGQFWGADCIGPAFILCETYQFTLSGPIQAPEYRLESRFNRAWLPAVDVSSRGTDQFMLRPPTDAPGLEPRKGITLEDIARLISEQEKPISREWLEEILKVTTEQYDRSSTQSESVPSIAFRYGIPTSKTMEELRQSIADLDASISHAHEDGISGFEECLANKYERERMNQQAIYEGGELLRHWWQHYVPPAPENKILPSRDPSGLNVVEEVWAYIAGPYAPELRDKLWLTGRDADLFQLQPYSDFDEDYLQYRIIPSDVLVPGSYQFRLHIQEAHFQPCGYYDELSATDYYVEVVAPVE